ncbi:CinA family protein [Idiomarina xiamenensis]|uniref:Competence/damage-inducible protein n=1 Tax=Idiomarina xiamenensis 10-D-4 TaxID=740709 RepID=K2KQR2_9GAMM|nr:CinA family protein [Idiomarina xiamenensis]EKE84784.1 competence/damage-inducible protein [Idiomarina xiamenensis 10-D-4]
MTIEINKEINQLAQSLGQLLQRHHYQIVTAESCTAGGIGYAISSIAGSSAWLSGGLITYSNALKQRWLSVSSSILEQQGAVSAECAQAMAQGALQQADANIAVAVTGIAGPDGGSEDKPVGLVWFAIACGDDCFSWSSIFSGDRAAVRQQTIKEALTELVEYLK